VLIEMESMSASFMRSYGSQKMITPHLDALLKQGVWFTHLYATGTRTVRGLEAMSAALPPLPGQSIVHRPNSKNIITLGGVLAEHDYAPMFMYGGYGAFDNMNNYFGSNGYAISDRSNFKKQNTSFATVWGVADEMLFNEALDQLDKDSSHKQKRFLHIMTTSNHRPYVYPEGRIDIPSKTGRDGAVKYTDWAIHQFLQKASAKPWFDKTLFVIVADHNASVAGKQSLPPNQYLIPALFYAPKMLNPRTVDTMSSQIDLPPTLLAMLGIHHKGIFFGENLLAEDAQARAFLVNYQELGRLTDEQNGQRDLVLLGPKRRVEEFDVDALGDLHRKPVSAELSNTAIAVFQKTDEVYSSGDYHLNNSSAVH
jgi:phosphoglycerol transferase MdoB-like AlkP superfamily enzyme